MKNPTSNKKTLSLSTDTWHRNKTSSQGYHKFFILIIPFIFLFLWKNKSINIFGKKLTDPYPNQQPPKPLFENLNHMESMTATIDKIIHVLEGFKKATAMGEFGKYIMNARNSSEGLNSDAIKGMIKILGNAMGEEGKFPIQNITSMLSVFEKITDMKKSIDHQRTTKMGEKKDIASYIDDMIAAIRPTLSEEQAKNIDDVKKMIQMFKLMSALDSSQETNPSSTETTDA
jgi:hypothetical protein